MHSSPFINSALLYCISTGEDFANEYLQECLKEVDHFFKNKNQHDIKPARIRKTLDGEYGAIEVEVWQ